MEMDPEAHVGGRVRLRRGRSVLVDLHDRNHCPTWDPVAAPARAEDPLFVATDERDPDSLRKIADEGAVFVSDLLTMDDRQAFGWPWMIPDVMALVEHQIARPQQLLLRTLFELLRGRDRELPVQAAMQTDHASGLNVGVFGIKSLRSRLSAAGWSEARRLEHGRSLTLPCDVHSTPIRTHSGSESTSCDT